MITIRKGGLRGGNSGCRDLYGDMQCVYCDSFRVKFAEQLGMYRTKWSCKDWEKHPHKHAYGISWIYDRTNHNDIQVNGIKINDDRINRR